MSLRKRLRVIQGAWAVGAGPWMALVVTRCSLVGADLLHDIGGVGDYLQQAFGEELPPSDLPQWQSDLPLLARLALPQS